MYLLLFVGNAMRQAKANESYADLMWLHATHTAQHSRAFLYLLSGWHNHVRALYCVCEWRWQRRPRWYTERTRTMSNKKKILRNITTYKTRTHIKSALIWVFAYITSHTRLFGEWWSFGTPFGCVYSICCCCRSHGCIKCCSLNQCVICLVLGANRRTAEQLLLMLVCCNMATVWRARANAKSFYRTIYYLCLAWRWCCRMSFNYPLLNSFSYDAFDLFGKLLQILLRWCSSVLLNDLVEPKELLPTLLPDNDWAIPTQ